MRMCGKVAAGLLTSLALWSATALAADHGWGGREAGGWVLRNVGLSDAQKTQIRQVFAGHRPRLRALREQLGAAERSLRQRLYSATPPTAADLEPINQLRASLAQERLQMALEIRALLTPDQLTKAQQLRQQMDQLQAQMRALVNPGP